MDKEHFYRFYTEAAQQFSFYNRIMVVRGKNNGFIWGTDAIEGETLGHTHVQAVLLHVCSKLNSELQCRQHLEQ